MSQDSSERNGTNRKYEEVYYKEMSDAVIDVR